MTSARGHELPWPEKQTHRRTTEEPSLQFAYGQSEEPVQTVASKPLGESCSSLTEKSLEVMSLACTPRSAKNVLRESAGGCWVPLVYSSFFGSQTCLSSHQ